MKANQQYDSTYSFQPFGKIPRLNRDITVTEKLDGTNASIHIIDPSNYKETPDDFFPVEVGGKEALLGFGSRKRFIAPAAITGRKDSDNFGFAAWAYEHKGELTRLGWGIHYGEWWGRGIQRDYGLKERRFSLFNVHRWHDKHQTQNMLQGKCEAPACCYVVPTLYVGGFKANAIQAVSDDMQKYGSLAAPDFDNPEGIIVAHSASRTLFKATFDEHEDSLGKERAAA